MKNIHSGVKQIRVESCTIKSYLLIKVYPTFSSKKHSQNYYQSHILNSKIHFFSNNTFCKNSEAQIAKKSRAI